MISYFGNRGGKVTVVEVDDDYLELVIRGLRGIVIPGNNEWERVQVVITLSKVSSGRRLRIQVDGSLASRINPPATDQSYDRDMEPRYSGALGDFARELLTLISRPQ